MKRVTNNKYLKKLPLLLVIFFGVYILYSFFVVNPRLDKKYLSDYEIVEGRFQSLYVKRPNYTKLSKVVYKINGKEYFEKLYFDAPCRTSDSKSETGRNEIFNFKFPIAVSKINHEYALPLLRPKDFKVINQPFPDSLKYMYERYFNCTFLEELNTSD